MSDVIENQIVQMSFDNKEFEKNISTSMKSLDEFKKEMEFSEEASNFKELEKVSESVDFDKLNKAIDGVGNHFTLIGRIGYKVVDDLASYFTNKIESMVNSLKSVTVDILDPKAGYAKYDEYTHGVKSIIAALSDTEVAKLESSYASVIDGVEEKLDGLMAYTDETSYDFVTMVGTIGKFLGAGIELDSAIADMQGIANWAALAGQNATTASQAMYQMSQALGAGYVKYMDWTQMANLKNMGTTVAKDTFIDAARELGYIQDEDIAKAKEMTVAAGAAEETWRNWFYQADQLNDQKWFKTEVLEKGLQKFSTVSNEVIDLIGDIDDITATSFLRAGKKVKAGTLTVSQAVEELTDGLGLNDEQLKQVTESMEKCTSAEYELGWKAFLAAQEAVTFKEAIDATKDAVGTTWMRIFSDLIGNYEEAAELWTDLANNLYDTLAWPLVLVERELREWSKSTITIFDDTGNEVEVTMRKYMWQGLSDVFAGVGSIFDGLTTSFKNFSDSTFAEKVVAFFNNLTFGLHRFADALNEIASSTTVLALSKLLRDLVNLGAVLFDIFSKIIKAVWDGVTGGDALDEALSAGVFSIDSMVVNLTRLLEKLNGSKGFAKSLQAIKTITEGLIAVLRVFTSSLWFLSDAMRGNTSIASNRLRESLIKLWEWIAKVFKFDPKKGITIITKACNVLGKAFDILSNVVKSVVNVIKEGWNSVTEIFESSVSPIEGAINSVIGILGGLVESFLNLIGEIFGFDPSGIINSLYNTGEQIYNAVRSHLANAGERYKNFFSDICDSVFNKLPERWNIMADKFKSGNGAQKVEEVLSFIGSCIRAGVEKIIEAVETVTGIDMTKFKSKILDFIDHFVEQTSKLKPGFEEAWDKLGKAFDALVGAFKKIGEAILWMLGELTGIENFGVEDLLDVIWMVFEKIVGLAIWFVGGVADIIVAAAPTIESTFTILMDFFTQFWLACQYIIGTDKSPEALKALEDMKKTIRMVIVIILLIEAFNFYKRVTNALDGISTIAGKIKPSSYYSTMQTISAMIKNIALLLGAISLLANQDIGGIAMACIALAVVMRIISSGFKSMLKELKSLAMFCKMSKIDPAVFEGTLNAISKILKMLGKLAVKIAVALTILAWATKTFGGNNMLIAFGILATTLALIIKGTELIVKASKGAKQTSGKLKQAMKVINKLIAGLLKIAVVFGLVALGLDAMLTFGGVHADEAIEGAMILMGGALTAIVIGSVTIVGMAKLLSPAKLEKVSTNVLKTTLLIATIGAAFAAMVYLLNNAPGGGDFKSTLKDFGIAAGVLTAITILITSLSFVMGKFLKPAVAKKLESSAKVLAKAVASIAMTAGAIVFLATATAVIVGTIAALTAIIKLAKPEEWIPAIAIAGGAIVVIAGFFVLLSQLKIQSAWDQILALSVMFIAVAASILTLTAALALMSKVTIDENVLNAMMVIGVIVAGLLAISAMVGTMSISLGIMSSMALALIELSGGIFMISLAMMMLSLVDAGSIVQGAIAMAILMTILMGFTALIAVIGPAVGLINALGNAIFKMALGVAILIGVILALTIIDKLAADLTQAMYDLNEKLPEMIEALTVLLVTLINSLAQSLEAHAQEIADSLFNLLKAIATIVFDLVDKIFGKEIGDKIRKFGELVWGIVKGIVDGIMMILNPILDFIQWVINGINKLIKWIKQILGIASPSKVFMEIGEFIIQGLWDGIKGLASAVWGFIVELFTGLWESIKEVFATILDFGKGLLSDLYDGIKDGFAKFWEKIKSIFSSIWGFITGALSGAFNLGKDIVTGLWDGINDMVEWVCKKITGFCDKALGAIKKFFGISSPSKVMAQMGDYLMLGFGEGIEDNQGIAIDACEEASENMLEEMRDVLGIHSASTETKGMGLNLMQGFTNGVNAGEGGLLDTVKEVGGDVLTSLSGALGGTDVLGMLTGNLSTASIEMPDMEMPEMDVANFNIDGYNYSGQAFDASALGLNNVYSMDIAPNYNGAGLSIPASYNPTVTDAQINQISSSYEDNSQEVINTLNEIKKQLAEQAEIMSKYQMVLDTGVLVGELATPIDRAIGNKARLANGRGI